MNKLKYYLVNGDTFVGEIYEDEKYGRSFILSDKIKIREGLALYDSKTMMSVGKNIDLIELIHELVREVLSSHIES